MPKAKSTPVRHIANLSRAVNALLLPAPLPCDQTDILQWQQPDTHAHSASPAACPLTQAPALLPLAAGPLEGKLDERQEDMLRMGTALRNIGWLR